MKRKKLVILSLVLSLFVPVCSQQSWTLQDCINYAIEHNLEIRKKEITQKQQELELNTAQFTRLPGLSGNVSQSFNFGRGLNETNAYVNRNTQNSSFDVSTDIPLFTGFQIPNTIAVSKLGLKAVTEDLNKIKEDISIQITYAFLQVLFNREIHKISLEQIELSKEQYERVQLLYELGKAAIAEVYETKARLAQDEVSAVQAENNYQLSILDLAQLLELPSPEGFEISYPDHEPDFTVLTAPEDIFNQSVVSRPDILAANYRLQAAEKNILIAKSHYYPKLSFVAGLGTSYYNVSGIDNNSFSKQIENNFSKTLGFRLSIPIFNRFETRNRIRNAQLQKSTYSIYLEENKKNLYKDVQQAYYNAIAAENKYIAGKSAVIASETAFRLSQEKYENGKANSFEFNEAKTNLMKVQSEQVQAKYEYIFRIKILDFYKGIPLYL